MPCGRAGTSSPVHKNPDCAVCGERPTVTGLVDYQEFCAVTPPAGAGMPGGSDPAASGGSVPQISALELADLLSGKGAASGLLLVDVRGSEERTIAGIPGAR